MSAEDDRAAAFRAAQAAREQFALQQDVRLIGDPVAAARLFAAWDPYYLALQERDLGPEPLEYEPEEIVSFRRPAWTGWASPNGNLRPR